MLLKCSTDGLNQKGVWLNSLAEVSFKRAISGNNKVANALDTKGTAGSVSA